VIDWSRVVGLLQEANWDGVLSCECGTSEQAARSLAHLEQILKKTEATHA
jgi:sugar phosphate isomerase/epimerase